jgi:putative glutamine amidotransferase
VSRPLIGVTPGFALPSPNREFLKTAHLAYVDMSYLQRVTVAGGMPFLLPHTDDESVLQNAIVRLDGLLLTGGEDVHPQYYGQAVAHDNCVISEPRDRFELQLIELFLPTGKPIFAICRGCQVLNVALGGTLFQDLPSQTGVLHHNQALPTSEPSHSVELTEGSRVAQALQMTIVEVNSHHHQAVDRLGTGLVVTGRSEEGIIESYEHTTHPFLLAVQWHPERLTSRMEIQQRLFNHFVQACAVHHG